MSGTDSRIAQDATHIGDGQRELLSKVARNIELGLRVAAPATVVSYNAATQKADLMMGFLPVLLGAVETPTPPVALPQVPVAWPRTNLGYLTFPLAPGDTGLVVFNDRNLGEWLRLGGPTDPVLSRCHDLADGVFLPGLHTDTTPIAPPTSAVATVLEGPLVNLGATATNGVVLDLGGAAAALTAAVTALSTIVATPIPEPPLPGAGAALDAVAAAMLAVVQALAVSTKVFAEPIP